MEKDYQNNNSISDAANNNEESNKPEHEIKVEIVSIEVVGEDTPPKHSKKYQHCFSYLLGKWCFLVQKNSFAEFFCHIPLPQYILPHYHILTEILLSFPFFF